MGRCRGERYLLFSSLNIFDFIREEQGLTLGSVGDNRLPPASITPPLQFKNCFINYSGFFFRPWKRSFYLSDLFDDFPIVDNGRIIDPELEGIENTTDATEHNPSDIREEQAPPLQNNGTFTEGKECVEEGNTDGASELEAEIISADEAEVITDVPDLSSDIDIDEKYRKLVDFYLVCGNKGKAAKLAGYKSDNPHSLRTMASRDFARPEVKEYLRLRRSEIAKKAEITHEAYMSEVVSIATLDIADVVETHLVRHTIENEPVYRVTFKDIADIPEHARKAVKQIKQNKDGSTELIFYDKLQALKLLGQIKGYLSADSGMDDGEETGVVMISEVDEDEQ